MKLTANQGAADFEVFYCLCLDECCGVRIEGKMAVEYLKGSANQANAYGQLKSGFCLQAGR
jgi:hypothetical protein